MELSKPGNFQSQQIPVHNAPVKAIGEALAVLVAHKDAWVALLIAERIAILEEISRDIMRVADRHPEVRATAYSGTHHHTPQRLGCGRGISQKPNRKAYV